MLNKVATMVLVLAQAAKTVGSFFSRHLLGCSVARTGRSKAAQGREPKGQNVRAMQTDEPWDLFGWGGLNFSSPLTVTPSMLLLEDVYYCDRVTCFL
jgi:hypothetical protein